MRFLGFAVLAAAVSIFAMRDSFLRAGKSSPLGATPTEAHGPVLVELFTSEGCSSCPPADSLLLKMDMAHSVENVEVIALEEHVDYWDDLGWRDPFSAHEWTERQQRYAYAFGQGSVYTPQMVVDGRAEFVGSREGQARQTIAELAGKKKAEVVVTAANSSDGKEHITVRVEMLPEAGAGDSSEVWLAITETGLHTAVTRGENAGEDLHHSPVVRMLRKIGTADAKNQDISFAGETNVSLDKGWQRNNLRAVIFVQQEKSRQIVGAAQAMLTQ